ncbi:MAG TPA: PepSY-associated TM helix domain-containing protein [Opitutaceae bacterium]|nr:PepSY-associated TM helix domain-containing protein [Opitutaceae bacterium]
MRKALFWMHLVVGVAAGLVIALMAATGTLMAFRSEITLWAEHDVRHVPVPVPAARMQIRDLADAVREARPDGRANQITVSRDPSAAVVFSVGRDDQLFVNPYTGEVTLGNHPALGAFFETVEGLHRWIGLTGRMKQVGCSITAACCALYLLLLLSGLFLWWPKKSDMKAFAAAVRLRFDRKGKARDWNWHTTVGFWVSPLLLLTTVTGLVMAYPWLADRLYKRPGKDQAAQVQPAGAQPKPAAHPLSTDAILVKVEAAYPDWDSIGMRTGGRRAGGAPGPGTGAAPIQPKVEQRGQGGVRPPLSLTLRDKKGWLALPVQLNVDPYTGDISVSENPSTDPFAKILRISAKAFHTGEALGLPGAFLMAISGLASLALVATGLSLAIRRLLAWNSRQGRSTGNEPGRN